MSILYNSINSPHKYNSIFQLSNTLCILCCPVSKSSLGLTGKCCIYLNFLKFGGVLGWVDGFFPHSFKISGNFTSLGSAEYFLQHIGINTVEEAIPTLTKNTIILCKLSRFAILITLASNSLIIQQMALAIQRIQARISHYSIHVGLRKY